MFIESLMRETFDWSACNTSALPLLLFLKPLTQAFTDRICVPK